MKTSSQLAAKIEAQNHVAAIANRLRPPDAMPHDPTNGAHALYMARCIEHEKNPPNKNWYWEGDGERHAMRYYVRHTCKAGRIDCESKADALNLARLLNKYKLAASIFPE